jgi:hypothetical protein
MSSPAAQRNRFEERKQAKRRRTLITWGVVALAVLALAAYLTWTAIRPAEGVAIPTAEAVHIPEGEDPGEFNSNPPTSGSHYDIPLPGGFYEESDLEQFGPYPLGYAMHSLEHGYIIFWYNCDLLSPSECEALKAELREYVEGSLNSKLIVYPWQDTDVPLVLSSWGYMLEMPEFNARQASAFINTNRLRAPEPNAP